MDPRWFLIQTKSCQEHRAARFLREWKAETLLPVLKETRRVTREPVPLFPGYVFSRFPETSIAKADITYGVVHVVRFGLTPAVVADELIVEIRGRLDEHGVVLPEVWKPRLHEFRKGELVRVKSGPFEGLTGVFDCRLNGTDRARILREMVAKGAVTWSRKPVQSAQPSVGVKVNLRDLEKIG